MEKALQLTKDKEAQMFTKYITNDVNVGYALMALEEVCLSLSCCPCFFPETKPFKFIYGIRQNDNYLN